MSNVQLFYFNAQGHLLKLYTQSHYIEVVQGGVSSAVEQDTIDCEYVAYFEPKKNLNQFFL